MEGMHVMLSRKDLEDIGKNIFEQYKQLPEIKDTDIENVNLDLLVRKVLNLNLEYHHLSLSGIVLGVTTAYKGYGYKIFDIPSAINTLTFMQDIIISISVAVSCH